MKKLTLALFAALILFGCSEQRPDVIERPVFEVWNSTTLEIDKIEMNDSATIFHFDAFFTPGWWIRIDSETYIRETGTDNRLILTHAEGIPIDEHYYMPESGETSFKLFFPPLPKNVTKIDFIESDCPDCFKIWGISLLPNKQVSVRNLAKSSSKKKGDGLPPVEFSTEPAIIKGQLIGFQNGMRPHIHFYYNNILSGEGNDIKIEIEEDGSFVGELFTGIPTIARSSVIGPVLLAPGEVTEVTVDLMRKSRFESRYREDKEPLDSVYRYQNAWGLNSSEIQVLSDCINSGVNYDEIFLEVAGMIPDELKVHLYEKLDLLKSELADKNLSEDIENLIISSISTSFFSMLINYEGFLRQAYFVANKISFDEWRTYDFQLEEPSDNYFSFINELWTDHMAYQSDFPFVVMSLRDAKGNRLLIDDFSYENMFVKLDSMVSEIFGQENKIVSDIAKGQRIMSRISNASFLSDDDKEIMRTKLSNPGMADYIIAENNKLFGIVEANRNNTDGYFVIHELPDTDPSSLFDAIKDKYRGKVVVVDFWATWCGPCIHANEQLKPLKDELTDAEVEFVYLAGENSPIGAWNRMIQDIAGQHYRVSDQQWQFWYEDLSIQGVPTIMIFDKNGEKISRFTGFPGVHTIKESIEKGLL
ncbi:TlpA family protein disulfide reductase [Alkalitalea saponilacus]|uniref:Thioredoxin-like n=1 Tax=Alkalitalea saponilacus TaxID=889453 RepID=A0A1T5HES8_9BACT|nr:TlpA disulfide reductase family protein [Alkalitalea saponilacus]ASB48075.1 hypothetical protein CDL62_02405 [Alkalitalea saponilacus]SKC19144.1 Thioredoxin-like [Alkalitalea saponilacus]